MGGRGVGEVWVVSEAYEKGGKLWVVSEAYEVKQKGGKLRCLLLRRKKDFCHT